MRRAILTGGVLILGLAGCGNSDLGDVAERQKEIPMKDYEEISFDDFDE